MKTPEGWKTSRLAELGTFLKGRGGSKKDEQQTGIPVIRYGELYTRHHELVRSFYSFVSPEAATRYTPLEIGDILFAGSGETHEEIGKSSAFLGPTPAHASGDVIILRPNAEVDPVFLGYATNSSPAVRQKQRLGQGSSVIHIYLHNLEMISLPIPPLPEQEKIAEILASVDEAIRATKALIEQTWRVKQGLLQQLLTRGIGHTRFKKTEIGEIPEGWEVTTVEKLCSFSGGHGFRPQEWSSEGLPIIRIQNLNGSRAFNYYSAPPDPRWVVEPGELLFAWAGVKGVSFGPCVWDGPTGVLNQHIYRIRPVGRVDQQWLYEILGLITSRIESKAHGFKASLLHVRKADIVNQVVPVPPPEEQVRFANISRDVEILAHDQMAQLGSLERTRKGLLENLLSGQVRVAV